MKYWTEHQARANQTAEADQLNAEMRASQSAITSRTSGFLASSGKLSIASTRVFTSSRTSCTSKSRSTFECRQLLLQRFQFGTPGFVFLPADQVHAFECSGQYRAKLVLQFLFRLADTRR